MRYSKDVKLEGYLYTSRSYSFLSHLGHYMSPYDLSFSTSYTY